MKIAVMGRGNVGGGLGDLWEKAGHDVAIAQTTGPFVYRIAPPEQL